MQRLLSLERGTTSPEPSCHLLYPSIIIESDDRCRIVSATGTPAQTCEKSIGRDWLNSRESFFIRIAKQVIREILSSKYERTWLHHRLYRTGRFYSDQNRTTSKVNVTPLIKSYLHNKLGKEFYLPTNGSH